MSCIQSVWDTGITNHLKTVNMERAFPLFIDQLCLGETGGAAFQAAFTYPCFAQGGKVATPTTIIATKAGLYEENLAACEIVSGANLVKVLIS